MDKFAPEERMMPKPGGVLWVKAIAEDGTFGWLVPPSRSSPSA